MELAGQVTAELATSDYSQLGSLGEWLRLTVPAIPVARRSGHSKRGEQGALDVLMVVADSSVIVTALKVLPEFLRSRKAGLSITVKVIRKSERKELTVTADNADQVLSLLERFLNG
jgi:hypothetical protein